MSNLWSWSARRLHDEFVQGAVSAETIVMAHLNRIEAIDSTVKAFLFVDAEGALQEARRQDRWSERERRLRPLSGVPLAVKDNIVTRTMPTSAGKKET